MPKPTANGRIAPVDGLRAVAVLGVLWIHNWLAAGAPLAKPIVLGGLKLDIQRFLALFGTGVDLFFVISGFCMYLMYIRKQTMWDLQAYKTFLTRRWLRLAPAFYVSAVFFALAYWRPGHPFRWADLLAHFTFTHTLIPDTNRIASHFWSLATEWHFYVALPLVVWASLRWGFWRMFAALALVSFAFRLWLFQQDSQTITVLSLWLPAKIIEFLWGIAVARAFVDGRALPRALRGLPGFALAFAVTLAGRMLMTAEAARLYARAPYLARVVSEPLLTLGYALMVWNVIASDSVVVRALESRLAQLTGRWSYSLYLWHWGFCMLATHFFLRRFGPSLQTQYLGLTCALLFLYPVSWLSYRYLEAPYFERWRKEEA